MKIENARILVTGGSSGIGKQTAQDLIKAGAQVLITGRDGEKLEKVATKMGAHFAKADIATPEGVAATIAAVKSKLGGLDVLINNAGYGEFDRLEDLTWEGFQRVFTTNVYGPAMLASGLVPMLKAQGSGQIINIASTASLKGFALGSMYSASKFALRSMTQCWQEELRKFNIRVCQVNPSEVTTAFADNSRFERSEQPNKLRPQEISDTILSLIKMDDRGFIPEVTVWATNPF